MALDERYITSVSLTSFLIDKTTGLPLDGSIEFWKDNDRATPKLVYQLSGSPPNYTYIALPNSMDVVGGNPVNNNGDNVAIYYFPYDENGLLELYYIVVKDSDGVIQETRAAWPDLAIAEDPTLTENSIVNALDNPQFVDVLFAPAYGTTITITGSVSNQVYNVAPYWDLIVSTNGNATITINRTSLAGSLNIYSNPPYTLDILTSGSNISSLKLRQRLTHNPGIFADGFIAGYMVISSVDGINHEISMEYAPSIAPSASTVCAGVTGTSGYVEVKGTIQLPPSVNTSDSDTGYIDINVILPVIGHYNVTSVQLVGMAVDNQNVAYDQQTVNRQKDGLFGYYNPLLQYKSQGSYLTAWDFPRNPSQWGGSQTMGTIGSNKAKYLWDQTIGYQSVNNSYSVARGTSNSFQITASATTQPAIIQYLAAGDSREILLNKISVFLKANSSKSGGCLGKVTLWYTTDASLPDLNSPNYLSLISTISSSGKPTAFNGNWTEVPRGNLGDATFSLSSNTSFDEFNFNGWNLNNVSAANNSTFMAIVIGFESIASSDIIRLFSVSLSSGDIAAPVIPYGFDSVMLDCRRFYEQSYTLGIAPGTVTTQDQIVFPMNDGADGRDFYTRTFQIRFPSMKRAPPIVYIYSPNNGAIDYAYYSVLLGGVPSGGVSLGTNPFNIQISTNWSSSSYFNEVFFTPSNATKQITFTGGDGGREGVLYLHYVADARLGLV